MKKQHGIYGYIAGIANAAILQPLQNIKMILMISPQNIKFSNNFLINIRIGTYYLWKKQKLRGFYKGLIPNVMKTGFSSALYFCSLRYIQKLFQQQNKYSLFLSSFLARVASAFAANPFAVIQTRFQMAGQNRWKGSIFNSFKKVYQIQGINGFFKGLIASCIKEGSFAGFYYMLYIEGKKLGFDSFVSGMTAGLLSTLITHPFQIIRAQKQVQILMQNGKKMQIKIGNQLVNLIKERQMFKGVAPRLVKKPLANTIAFLLFQALENNQNNNKKQ